MNNGVANYTKEFRENVSKFEGNPDAEADFRKASRKIGVPEAVIENKQEPSVAQIGMMAVASRQTVKKFNIT